MTNKIPSRDNIRPSTAPAGVHKRVKDLNNIGQTLNEVKQELLSSNFVAMIKY